jgi:hypothetical protein
MNDMQSCELTHEVQSCDLRKNDEQNCDLCIIEMQSCGSAHTRITELRLCTKNYYRKLWLCT